MDKKYIVKTDRQGGTFGQYRIYTIEQWRKQAIIWAEIDDNDELLQTLKTLPKEKVIDFIDDFWDLEFQEISEEDFETYKRAEKDFQELHNIVYDWKGSLEELCKKLGGHNLENHLFDLNYKHIVATIIEDINEIYLSCSVEIWDSNDCINMDWNFSYGNGRFFV